jgi:plastocyanin
LLVLGVVLASGALPSAAPAAAGQAARSVSMRDNAYLPTDTELAQGQAVRFTNFGQLAHDAVDDTGLELFATAVLEAPDAETVGPLPGSGIYRYYCTFHPDMVGRLRVPVTVTRSRTTAGSVVVVRVATERAPEGLVFDVQLRRPGGSFVAWRTGVVRPVAAFRPAVRGSWTIRARVREAMATTASAWSERLALPVT